MKNSLCEGASDKNARVIFESEECVVYCIRNNDGELHITEYAVFSGIWLVYKDSHTYNYVYPSTYPPGLLEINHCFEGRFEYDAGEQFFYLAKGDMSIHQSMGPEAAVNCPTRHFHGISVIINPQTAPKCLSCFLDDVNVEPLSLSRKFCRDGQYFIMRSTPRLEHIFSELYSVPNDIRKGYFKVKILELLLFLSSLDPMMSQTQQHTCSRVQVELAKEVCNYISGHMNVRLTIEQLASRFYVSPAQLKKCFYSVYGESVYAYIRTYKMQEAAILLRTTDYPISDIAGAFGYDNSSKFAKAFRDVIGVSPTGYRQSDIIKNDRNIYSERKASCLE